VRKFWCNLDKRIFEKQFKNKGEIRKISKWRAPIKNQNGGAKFENSYTATIPRYSNPSLCTGQNSKMVMVLPCDENTHIIYRWKEYGEENTMR
jgi:hypothetical protein